MARVPYIERNAARGKDKKLPRVFPASNNPTLQQVPEKLSGSETKHRVHSAIFKTLKDAGDIDVKGFALVYLDDRNQIHRETSTLLAQWHDDIINQTFVQDFAAVVNNNEGSLPATRRGAREDAREMGSRINQRVNVNSAHSWAEDTVKKRPRSLKAEELFNNNARRDLLKTPPKRRTDTYSDNVEQSDESDDFDEFERAVTPPKELVSLSDRSSLDRFYEYQIRQLQQSNCKLILKAWIKALHPKKQARYPYNKEAATKPDWWPPIEFCRHREPDHLSRDERVYLMKYILVDLEEKTRRENIVLPGLEILEPPASVADQKKTPLTRLLERASNEVLNKLSNPPKSCTRLHQIHDVRVQQLLDIDEGCISGIWLSLDMPDQESHPPKPKKRKFSTPSISPKEESPSGSSSDVIAMRTPSLNTRYIPQRQLGSDCGDHPQPSVQTGYDQANKAWPAQQLSGDAANEELTIKHEPSEAAQSQELCLDIHPRAFNQPYQASSVASGSPNSRVLPLRSPDELSLRSAQRNKEAPVNSSAWLSTTVPHNCEGNNALWTEYLPTTTDCQPAETFSRPLIPTSQSVPINNENVTQLNTSFNTLLSGTTSAPPGDCGLANVFFPSADAMQSFYGFF